MLSTALPSLPVDPPAARLLVLLPLLADEAARQERVATLAGLRVLQQRLGSVIRVLAVEEASHPAVVRSFQDSALPAGVLVRDGIELWRYAGRFDVEPLAVLLLSKLP